MRCHRCRHPCQAAPSIAASCLPPAPVREGAPALPQPLRSLRAATHRLHHAPASMHVVRRAGTLPTMVHRHRAAAPSMPLSSVWHPASSGVRLADGEAAGRRRGSALRVRQGARAGAQALGDGAGAVRGRPRRLLRRQGRLHLPAGHRNVQAVRRARASATPPSSRRPASLWQQASYILAPAGAVVTARTWRRASGALRPRAPGTPAAAGAL